MRHRDELANAIDDIAGLAPGWIAVLGSLVVCGMIAEGVYASAVTPGITWVQGAMVQQSATAANNTVVGSGPISTGVRIAMLKSWRVSDTSVGLTIVTLNVVAAYKLWLIALATSIAGLAGAAGDVVDRRVFVVVIAAASVVLTASTVLWWLLLRHPRTAAWLAERAQRLFDRARRRFTRLPYCDLVTVTEHARVEARDLTQVHGIRIVITSAIDQVFTLAKPIAVIFAFGMGSSVITIGEILVAYGLVRLAVALTPIPGGIAVTEIGLAALLTRFGGPETTVLAAIIVYRALTFLLPIFTGGACFAAWRWQRLRTAPPMAHVSPVTILGDLGDLGDLEGRLMNDDKVVVRHRGCDGIIATLDGGALRAGHTPTFKRMGAIGAIDVKGLATSTLLCRKCEAVFAVPPVWEAAHEGLTTNKVTVRLSAPPGPVKRTIPEPTPAPVRNRDQRPRRPQR